MGGLMLIFSRFPCPPILSLLDASSRPGWGPIEEGSRARPAARALTACRRRPRSRPWRRNGSAARASVTWMSDSGAAWCPVTRRQSSRSSDAGVRGFKCFLVPSGVDEFQHTSASASSVPRCEILARRNVVTGPCRVAGPHHPASWTSRHLPRLRGDTSGRRRSGRDSTDGAPGSRHGRARAHRPRVVGGRRRGDCRGPRRGRADHGRDVPALPDVFGGGDSRL